MHIDPNHPTDRMTADEDRRLEALVLTHSLASHPAHLTIADLSRLFGVSPGDFPTTDAIERAIGQLECSGLVHRTGQLVTPTVAAIRADALIGGSLSR
jgi:glutamate synthase domain-containing protein 2